MAAELSDELLEVLRVESAAQEKPELSELCAKALAGDTRARSKVEKLIRKHEDEAREKQ